MSLHTFFSWWQKQLLSLLPGQRREKTHFSARPILYASWQEDRITLELHYREKITDLGTLTGEPEHDRQTTAECRTTLTDRMSEVSLVLQLPQETIMRRRITLPIATENDLTEVLAYEMDRLTPFETDAVHFSHCVVRHDRQRRHVVLDLFVVPRALLKPALDRLAPLDRTVEAVEDGEQTRRIPLLRSGRSGKKSIRPGNAVRVVPACLILCLLIGAFWRQSIRLTVLERQEAALRPVALEASAFRRKVEDYRVGQNMLHSARTRIGDPLPVLAALTDALPDSSYLTDFSLHQGQILIGGQSREPTALIQRMSASSIFKNPAFSAPVTKISGQNASFFSIRADLGH